MRFSTVIISLVGIAGITFAVPFQPITDLETRASEIDKHLDTRDCDCNAQKDCTNNCLNGFGENPVGAGLCVLTCGDAAGCGPNEVCHDLSQEEFDKILSTIGAQICGPFWAFAATVCMASIHLGTA